MFNFYKYFRSKMADDDEAVVVHTQQLHDSLDAYFKTFHKLGPLFAQHFAHHQSKVPSQLPRP